MGVIAMKRLFGTDGIRGRAGEFPLDPETIRLIGASVARLFERDGSTGARFMIGRDTRESGEWIEKALFDGISFQGAEAESAGVMTTPGVAFLTSAFGFDAGIVISASHNPFYDNGIKIFLPSGRKMGERFERQIEADIFDGREKPPESVRSISEGRAAEFISAYLDHLFGAFPGLDLSGVKLVVDCANGAASAIAPRLFERFGASVVAINNSPNGKNINDQCGSLYIEQLRQVVVSSSADLGVAFDGDADRALFVNENGEVVDGDGTLWIMAKFLREQGKLRGNTVVATTMSNIGLEKALESIDLRLDRADVGDKYVLERLIETGSEIGGEQSGHIIFPMSSLVGDGMMTALNLLEAITFWGTSLSAAIGDFVRYPQILVNVNVREKTPFASIPALYEKAIAVEKALNGNGRLLLRYSGTEKLARVMIEGREHDEISDLAESIAAVIRQELG
jgi:phosphoglucosamine mutase